MGAREEDETAGRITLAEIAAQAGLSLSTVSKVLNGRSDVSAATRSRVEQLLAEHGYRRRSAAASHAPLIELVFHELESVWAMELIRGVENVAQRHRLSVVVTESGTRHAPGREWLDGVLQRRPRGVVLVFSALPDHVKKQLRSRAIPFVIVDPAGDPQPDVPSVGSANWSGGVAATRHLLDHGHERIAIITGPADLMCSLARLDGYRSAMAMAACGPTHATSGTATSTSRAASATPWNCSTAPTGRPRSSRAATSRRWASWRPPAARG
ncbi:hypothetical protein GCM10020256_57110 [Streptomyces thermocoprophilus]